MATTLLLFDIDGTLIRGSRAGQVAYARAIHGWLGILVDLNGIQFSGRTDLLILGDILTRYGQARELALTPEMEAAYVRHFAEALSDDPGTVCPGVRELLHVLSGRAGMQLAIGTGNLERVARMKLAVHRLETYFETGGFGSDAAAREDVIAAGIARTEARRGVRFDRIVVLGDTPHDVVAAHANDVHSLGVATGSFDQDTLRQAGATVIMPDLAGTDAVIRAIEALPPVRRA